MKKMFVLLFVFVTIAASAHAAIQYKVEVVSTRFEGRITASDGTTNQVCTGSGSATTVQTPCSFNFTAGKTITLTGSSTLPQAEFSGWGPVTGNAVGACGTAHQCSFTLTQDTKATAKITPTFHIRVALAAGSGPGTIRVKQRNQIKIECTKVLPQETCSIRLPIDSNITIENVPGPNQQFGGYETNTGSAQACTSQSTTCSFVLKADTIVFSKFQ